MKIFYAIQATGNGHISRAIQLYPYLKQFGNVDFFLSGSNMGLDCALPVKYRSRGLSLFYSKGGLDYWKMIKNFKPYQLYKDAKSLPLKDYDIIINDFEPVTALACKMQNVASVQFGHQASFMSDKAPRPQKRDLIGEVILKKFATASKYIGLHFKQYDEFIFPPVIKDDILSAIPSDLGHVTVYLPSVDQSFLEKILNQVPEIHFQWFLKDVITQVTVGNISYQPVSQHEFNQSLISCHGIITGAGFETPAEAMYLNKKLLCIPIQGQYEQYCNGAALQKIGVTVLPKVNQDFDLEIKNWLNQESNYPKLEPNNIMKTLNYLFENFKK
jgi:uncharacterized protein (TIGR00661 family)